MCEEVPPITATSAVLLVRPPRILPVKPSYDGVCVNTYSVRRVRQRPLQRWSCSAKVMNRTGESPSLCHVAKQVLEMLRVNESAGCAAA
jgi:hypothetical protein